MYIENFFVWWASKRKQLNQQLLGSRVFLSLSERSKKHQLWEAAAGARYVFIAVLTDMQSVFLSMPV
jgi:hypothetical protein